MAVFKCKMCGGDLQVESGMTTGVCEYCGTRQTLPRLSDDRRAQMYDRANHFRRNNDYDKAAGIYEAILNEDSTDAEAYWSLVLCKYGVEYVEDPKTKKRIPTCNRTQFTSIFADEDYKQALAYADEKQREIYEEEAKEIDRIQKGILEISGKEEPFDVFICYKETDEHGKRTRDSVLAQEIYNELTNEGYKVFFSRITLENVLGTAYEPYIFAALNSAKVMVVVGTRKEHFNAVWVKNEWSRYLALIKGGAKKVLIPAYRDMDPYDLPEEFSHLQALDMGKLGFMQDLVRGIKKIIGGDDPKASGGEKQIIVAAAKTDSNPDALLKRAFLFLEDGDFDQAAIYFNRVLDLDPEYGEAYVGLLCIEQNVRYPEALQECESPFSDSSNYKKAVRFGSHKVEEYNQKIIDRIEREKKAEEYNRYSERLNELKNSSITGSLDAFEKAEELRALADSFKNLDYMDSAGLSETCLVLADEFETSGNNLLEQEKAITAEQERLRTIKKEKNKIRRRKIIKFSLIACTAIIAALFIYSVFARIPPGSRAVKKYLIDNLEIRYGDGKTKITGLKKNGNQWDFAYIINSEKDEVEGSGYVTVYYDVKNILFYKFYDYWLHDYYTDEIFKPKQGVSEQEVMDALYQYAQAEYDVEITPSETIQGNKSGVYVKGSAKGYNFFTNIDTELQFEYKYTQEYYYRDRRWICTNLDSLFELREPIIGISEQAVKTGLKEWLISEGYIMFGNSIDNTGRIKITDLTIENLQYDESCENANLQVSIVIAHPRYTISGSASVEMQLYDGNWIVAKADLTLQETADPPKQNIMLLLVDGKNLDTDYGTIIFDKSKISNIRDTTYNWDRHYYVTSFTADYSSDLFTITGKFSVTLYWDMARGYEFTKAEVKIDSVVLSNKNAFTEKFSSTYYADEEYGIGKSGSINITFKEYNDSNNMVTAKVSIGGRLFTMTGTINPFNCVVGGLYTDETFDATVEVPMFIFRGITTTVTFREISVSLSGLYFNWNENICSGIINIKHNPVIGYDSEGSAWF